MGLLERLFCPHLQWSTGKPLGDFKMRVEDYIALTPYHCDKCKKLKYFKYGEFPINYARDNQ